MRYFATCLALTTALSTVGARADVTAAANPGNPKVIVIRNELLRLAINLERGAHVISCTYAGFDGENIVFDWERSNGGLFKDLWYTQGWPGEFDRRTYQAEIVKAGPDEAVVKTWTMSTGVFKKRKIEDLADHLFVKTFRLKKAERMLEVTIEVTNKGDKGKRPAYWLQHALDFDGERKNSVYWRSTQFGVDWISDEQRVSDCGFWYVAKVNAGWNGVTNPKLRRGVMFLIDYNDLQQVYDNTAANTIEWMYDDVAIPAGKTWRTVVRMIPTEGFAGYSYADEQIIGYVQAVEVAGGLRITHTVAATAWDWTGVTVDTNVRGAAAAWTVAADSVSAERLGREPLSSAVMATGIGPMPCVVKVTVSGTTADGKPASVSFEDYVGGSAGRNKDLTTLEPIAAFPVPEKRKQYLKPDTIELQRLTPPRVLFIRGLWAEFQGIDQALAALGEVTVVDGWMKKSALGETLGNFPASYEDLTSYDVIILGNVSGPMLSSVGQEMLADFLKAGGGVMFLSGDRTYGQTRFENANFAQLLPIALGDGRGGDYGRLKTPQGFKPARHPVTRGVKFPPGDVALYTHYLKPGDRAAVAVALSDGTPALIVSGDSRPRVACVAPLPFGEAPPGRTLYGDSNAWQALMANTVRWLMGK